MLVRLRAKEKMQAVGAIVLVMALLALCARGQELDGEWFKSSYLPAAKRLHDAYSSCSAKVSETITNDKNQNFHKIVHDFAISGERRKFDRTITDRVDGSEESWTRTIVASPEVSFMVITKHASEPLLEQVNRSPLGFMVAARRIDESAAESIYSAFAFLGEQVSDWVKHPGFQFKRVLRNGERVRLEFVCNDQQDNRQYSGWVDFVPERQWVIDGWDITIAITDQSPPYSWRDTARVTYGGNDPVPQMTGMTLVEHHGDRVETRNTVVRELTFGALPASEFKLSDYGYDDRIGMPAPFYRSLWFWLAVIGTVSLIAAGLIRIRWRLAF